MMLTGDSRSYYESYMRGKRPGKNETQRLLTDRTSYLSYLEVQLERVSAACMTSQSYGERIEQLQTDIRNLHEKTANMSRATKLTQQLGEEEGQHTNKKLEELSSKVQSLQSDMAKYVLEGNSKSSGTTKGTLTNAVEALGQLSDRSALAILKESASVSAREIVNGLPIVGELQKLHKWHLEIERQHHDIKKTHKQTTQKLTLLETLTQENSSAAFENRTKIEHSEKQIQSDIDEKLRKLETRMEASFGEAINKAKAEMKTMMVQMSSSNAGKMARHIEALKKQQLAQMDIFSELSKKQERLQSEQQLLMKKTHTAINAATESCMMASSKKTELLERNLAQRLRNYQVQLQHTNTQLKTATAQFKKQFEKSDEGFKKSCEANCTLFQQLQQNLQSKMSQLEPNLERIENQMTQLQSASQSSIQQLQDELKQHAEATAVHIQEVDDSSQQDRIRLHQIHSQTLKELAALRKEDFAQLSRVSKETAEATRKEIARTRASDIATTEKRLVESIRGIGMDMAAITTKLSKQVETTEKNNRAMLGSLEKKTADVLGSTANEIDQKLTKSISELSEKVNARTNLQEKASQEIAGSLQKEVSSILKLCSTARQKLSKEMRAHVEQSIKHTLQSDLKESRNGFFLKIQNCENKLESQLDKFVQEQSQHLVDLSNKVNADIDPRLLSLTKSLRRVQTTTRELEAVQDIAQRERKRLARAMARPTTRGNVGSTTAMNKSDSGLELWLQLGLLKDEVNSDLRRAQNDLMNEAGGDGRGLDQSFPAPNWKRGKPLTQIQNPSKPGSLRQHQRLDHQTTSGRRQKLRHQHTHQHTHMHRRTKSKTHGVP